MLLQGKPGGGDRPRAATFQTGGFIWEKMLPTAKENTRKQSKSPWARWASCCINLSQSPFFSIQKHLAKNRMNENDTRVWWSILSFGSSLCNQCKPGVGDLLLSQHISIKKQEGRPAMTCCGKLHYRKSTLCGSESWENKVTERSREITRSVGVD